MRQQFSLLMPPFNFAYVFFIIFIKLGSALSFVISSIALTFNKSFPMVRFKTFIHLFSRCFLEVSHSRPLTLTQTHLPFLLQAAAAAPHPDPP